MRRDINTVELTPEVVRDWLTFDKHNLDEEFLSIPMMIYRLGVEVAHADSERDRLKQKLDVKKAEVDADVRKSPADYKIEKVTEAAISGAVISDTFVRNFQQDLIKASEKVSILEAGRNALRDKLTAMTYTFKLYEANYFADGKMPKGSREAMEEAGAKSQKDLLNKKLRRD